MHPISSLKGFEKKSTMQGPVPNPHLSEKESGSKTHRRPSNSSAQYNGDGISSRPFSMEHLTDHKNKSKSERTNTMAVSVFGLFFPVICYAYALIVSKILTMVLRWKSNAFSQCLINREYSNSDFFGISRVSKNRNSSKQG